MAQKLLADAQRKQKELIRRRSEWQPMREPCPLKVSKLIMRCLDFKTRTKFERVNRDWKQHAADINKAEERSVWMYMIFRKGHLSGHDRLTVSLTNDGPIFWSKVVVYLYCCSCHYNSHHETPLLGILRRLSPCVQRVCLVDSPIDYPFLTDSFFYYISTNCPRLMFIYIREIDLQNVSHQTVKKFAAHPTLKKMIVHSCRKYDVLQDFGKLPQLMVVKGEIQGLKVLLGDFDASMQITPKSSISSTPGRRVSGGVVNDVQAVANGTASDSDSVSARSQTSSTTNNEDNDSAQAPSSVNGH